MKSSAQTDVYQMVTDLIIEKLESGIVPWRKPFTVIQIFGGLYTNSLAIVSDGLCPWDNCKWSSSI